LPGVAVVVLGTLYALGALLKTRELVHADVPVRDTLPLVPIEQHLGRGMAEVFAEPAVPAIFILMAALAVYQDRRFRTRSERRRQQRTQDLAQLQDLVRTADERLAALGERIHGGGIDPAERQKLETEIAEVRKIETEARQRIRQMAPARDSGTEKSTRWRKRVTNGLAIAGVVVSAALLPIPLAVAYLLMAVMVFSEPLRRFRFRLVIQTTFFFVLISAGLLATALFYPRALSEVELDTTNGESIEGGIVTVADRTWVVATGDESFVTIPADRIDTVKVTSPHYEPGRGILELIIGRELLDANTGD
jgi:hypothetical protein